MSYLSARRFVSLVVAFGILAIPTLVAFSLLRQQGVTATTAACRGSRCDVGLPHHWLEVVDTSATYAHSFDRQRSRTSPRPLLANSAASERE